MAQPDKFKGHHEFVIYLIILNRPCRNSTNKLVSKLAFYNVSFGFEKYITVEIGGKICVWT